MTVPVMEARRPQRQSAGWPVAVHNLPIRGSLHGGSSPVCGQRECTTAVVHRHEMGSHGRAGKRRTNETWPAVRALHPRQVREMVGMNHTEVRGQLVADALRVCPGLKEPSSERDALWIAVQDGVCTRSLRLVVPLGSSSLIPVTTEHRTAELIAAMTWLAEHEQQARAMPATSLYVKLRGIATRGATGSARAAQSDALHGMTNVPPGQPVVFTDIDTGEVAS